jgi:hypothetical protein
MQTVRNSEDIAGEKPNANRRAQTAKNSRFQYIRDGQAAQACARCDEKPDEYGPCAGGNRQLAPAIRVTRLHRQTRPVDALSKRAIPWP